MLRKPFVSLTAAAATGGPYWGHSLADLQSGVTVAGDAITGTLKYVSTGTLATDWGAGNFLALKFTDIDTTGLTSLKVGLSPSEGSGLVELLGDPDMDGVFKVTDKDAQKLVIEATDGTQVARRKFDLSGLTCEDS